MTPSQIPIGRTGRIVDGVRDVGRFVRVEQDAHGHFLVITSPNREFVHGEIDDDVWDDWVEDGSALTSYFVEQNWAIEWLD